MAVFEDITARKHSDEARRNSQERFELLFEGAPIAIALLAPDGRVVRANRSLLSTMGYSSEQLLSKRLTELTHPEDLSNDNEQLRRLMAGEIAEYQVDKRYLHARGHIIYARLSLSLMRDREDKPLHFIAYIQDLTEQRLTEQRLTELDQRDPLTGMLARRYFERELAQRVASHASDGKISALALFDVNDFRRINEQHGHRVGDELLMKFATALTGRLRGTDLIARLGSDEFAVLLVDIQPGVAETVAGEVAGVLADVSVQAEGLSVSVTVSHGVIYIDGDLSDGAEALTAAERAMRT
jgi:diguanylate cyclase (GGDEF)-like protein/PAS domain S-box-containing protein